MPCDYAPTRSAAGRFMGKSYRPRLQAGSAPDRGEQEGEYDLSTKDPQRSGRCFEAL